MAISDYMFGGTSPLLQKPSDWRPTNWLTPFQEMLTAAQTPKAPSAGAQPLSDAIFGAVPTQSNVPRSSLSSTAPAAYSPTINAAAAYYNVDPSLLTKQIWQESSFDPKATSSAGAKGISQFMPGTAKRYGVDVNDPHSSIWGQAAYMSDLSRQFGGNTGLATAGYNWGEGNVQKWLRSGSDIKKVPKETRAYVERITGRKLEDWVK